MPSGLQIFNPSSTIVVSSDGAGYKYFGAATLYSSGYRDISLNNDGAGHSYYAGYLYPYVYRITLPDSSMVPMVGITLATNRITCIGGVQPLGSGVWQIEVWSCTRPGALNMSAQDAISPGTIHVFCPVSNADLASGAGLQLFDAAGNLTFSSDVKPLWFRERINFSYNLDTSAPDNLLRLNGDGVTWGNLSSTVLMLAGIAGESRRVNTSSGEDICQGYFGWTYTGTTLKREYFTYHHDFRDTNGGDGGASVGEGAAVEATIVLGVDGSLL